MREVEQRHVVGAILYNERGEVLLQQRDHKPNLRYAGCWTLFGGAVEDGETFDEAIRRELIEELDLEVLLTFWLDYECPARTVPGEVVTTNHVYVGQVRRDLNSLTLLEGQAMAYFTPEAAALQQLAFEQSWLIEQFYRRHNTLPAVVAAETAGKGMTTKTMTGVDAVTAIFEQAKTEGRAAFLPYFPIGYPTYDASLDAITEMAALGVDGFEIGIPFSDPLADGPVIQAATQIALENGMTTRRCLEAVRELRARGVTQPMLLMGYLNPILAYGVEAFVADVKAAGAEGLIVPDLPPDEGEFIAEVCQREGLALVFFVAPTSSDERIALVAQRATGFIYVVSLTGITGERKELPADLTEFVSRLRKQTRNVPLVMGFGISTPEHVRLVSQLVDGVIVGSAIVRAGKAGTEAVRTLTQALLEGLSAE